MGSRKIPKNLQQKLYFFSFFCNLSHKILISIIIRVAEGVAGGLQSA
jgi:hypothetical protein